VFEHHAVIGGVEGAFEVRVYDVDVLVVNFGVLLHHDEGGEGIVDAAEEEESILLFVENSVRFCVLGAGVFMKQVLILRRLFMIAIGR
jgi:hypothetical protein